MVDHLAKLAPPDLAAFYHRLADFFDKQNNNACGKGKPCLADPMASNLLRKWLNNRSQNTIYLIDPPMHLKTDQKVKNALLYHRKVFLTEEKARIGPKFRAIRKWVGVVPRLKKMPGFSSWSPGKPLQLRYESNVEYGTNRTDIARIQYSGTPAERDLLVAFRGWTLISNVAVNGTILHNKKVKITFLPWKCSGSDLYDFAKVKGFTLPNPDYQKDFEGAVRPKDKTIKIHHGNAVRLQKAGLASPYKIVIKDWIPQDAALTQPAEVDLNRTL